MFPRTSFGSADLEGHGPRGRQHVVFREMEGEAKNYKNMIINRYAVFYLGIRYLYKLSIVHRKEEKRNKRRMIQSDWRKLYFSGLLHLESTEYTHQSL